MHMVDKWSYRLAEHCNDKGVRAKYWYLRHGCLVSVSTPLNNIINNYQCVVHLVYGCIGTNNLTIEHDTTDSLIFCDFQETA